MVPCTLRMCGLWTRPAGTSTRSSRPGCGRASRIGVLPHWSRELVRGVDLATGCACCAFVTPASPTRDSFVGTVSECLRFRLGCPRGGCLPSGCSCSSRSSSPGGTRRALGQPLRRCRSRRSSRRRRPLPEPRRLRSSSTSRAPCVGPGSCASPKGARVADAIARAGGLTRRRSGPGSTSRLLSPTASRCSSRERGRPALLPAEPSAAAASGPVSLSSATAEQLDTLPGIGPVTAQKIVAYRTAARRLSRRSTASTRSRASARRASPSCRGWSCRERSPACARRCRSRCRLGLVPGRSRRLDLGAGVGGSLSRSCARARGGAAVGGAGARRAARRSSRAGGGAAPGSTRSTAAPCSRRSTVRRARSVVVTAEPRVGSFEQRVFARVHVASAARRSTSPSSSSCRSAVRRRRAPRSTPARGRAAAARPVARLRRAHLAAPARHPCRPQGGRMDASTGRRGGARRRRRPPARLACAAHRRPGSRENAARSSKASCSATTTGSRPTCRTPSGARASTTCSRSAARTSCCSPAGVLGLALAARRPTRWAAPRRARGDRRVRARRRPAAVGDPRGGRRRGSSRSPGSRRGERDPWHVAAARRGRPARLEPVHVFDAGFQLSFAAVVAIFLAVGPLVRDARGLSGADDARRGGRGLGGVQRSRPRRSSGSSSARCRCSASPPTRSSSRPSAAARARASRPPRVDPVSPALAAGARVDQRLGRRVRRALRALVGSLPFAQARGRGAALAAAGSLLAARLCLAAMADELKPAYLIAGSDRPKVDRAVRGCAAASTPTPSSCTSRRARPATTRSPRATRSASSAASAGSSSSRGSRRGRRRTRRRSPTYLKAPAPGDDARARRRRAEEGRAAREGRRARRASSCSGTSRRRRCALGRRAVQAARRRRPSPRPAALLAELVGDDLYELAAEIDKLATWAAGDGDHRGRRRGARRPAGRVAAFALTDAWGARDVGGVLLAAERCSSAPRDPRSRTIPRSSASSPTTSRARARASCSRTQGLSAQDAAGRLGRHPFSSQKLYAQARNFTADELDDALVRLAQLDHALKGGSRLPTELELERALVEITAPPRVDCASRLRAGGGGSTRGAGRRAAQPATSCAPPVFRCSAPRATARSISLTRLRARSRSSPRRPLRRRREALRQRLDRRAVAQVLEPLVGGGADALLLLRDVRHSVKTPAQRARGWYQRRARRGRLPGRAPRIVPRGDDVTATGPGDPPTRPRAGRPVRAAGAAGSRSRRRSSRSRPRSRACSA